MAAGLFELRKDAITGWWVATVVDREFLRERFALAAEPVDDGGDCRNCREPAGDGVRVRVLKDYAFHVVGTEAEARELDRAVAQVALASGPGGGELADRRRSARRAPPAPRGRRRTASPSSCRHARGAVAEATRAGADGVPPGAPELGRARPAPGRTTSAWTSTTCPRSRTGLPRRSAGPPASSSARASARTAGRSAWSASGASRFVWEDAHSVAFAPYASRSPFEVWVVPRRHEADFGRATDDDLASTAEALRQVLGRLSILDGPPVQPRPPHGAARRPGGRHLPLALGDPPAPPGDRRPGARHRACR